MKKMEPQRSISPVSANGNNKQMLKVMCTGLALLAAQQHNRAEAQQPVKQHFNIPAQSLQSALNQFSEDADIQMSYPAQLSKGIKTNGISGDYTREEAIKQLLAGSGLASSIVSPTTPSPLKRPITKRFRPMLRKAMV
ncbi:MAG: STN domain-containing protein [Methylococcaceae bacterium]